MNEPVVRRDDFWGDFVNALFFRPVYRPVDPARRPAAPVPNKEASISAPEETDSEIGRTTSAILISEPLPGLDADRDIKTSVEGGVLIIEARTGVQQEDQGRLLFRRKIPLPAEATVDGIVSSHHNGVLTVRIPLGPASHLRATDDGFEPWQASSHDVVDDQDSTGQRAQRTAVARKHAADANRPLGGTVKIGYFVGSLASGSINRVLANALIKLAPENLEFMEIPIKDLPLYSYDYDTDFPPEGRALKEAIEASDGILFVSPEYNRSIPGALKNAIDWGSRPWGSNSFAGKPTGIIGASAGGVGTAVMQASFRSVLSFLDAPQLNAPEAYIHFDAAVFGDDGEVKNEGTAKFLRHYMDEYAAFVARVLATDAPGHIGDTEPDAAKLLR